MLFVVIHQHTGAECMVDAPGPVETVASDDHAEQCGVKVHGMYVAPPEHHIFFTLETDTYENIIAFLLPLSKIGTHRVYPVSDLRQVNEMLQK